MTSDEFETLRSISESFTPGKWVAIVGEHFIQGDDCKTVYGQMKEKYPTREVFIIRVPEGGPRCP